MSCTLAVVLKVVALLHLQYNIVHHYVIDPTVAVVIAKAELVVLLLPFQTKSKA